MDRLVNRGVIGQFTARSPETSGVFGPFWACWDLKDGLPRMARTCDLARFTGLCRGFVGAGDRTRTGTS